MRLTLLLEIFRLLFILEVVANDKATITTRAPDNAIVVTFYAPIRIFEPQKTKVSSTSTPYSITTTALPKVKTTSPKKRTGMIIPTLHRCRKFEMQPDEEDCKYFYYCWLTGSFRAKCPSGTLFDRNVKRCNNKNFVKCFNGRTCPQSKGLFPDTKFCSMYLNCDRGIPYLRKCPSGLVFHPTSRGQGFCDYPYNVECAENSIITHPDANSQKIIETNPEFESQIVMINTGMPEL